MKRRIYLSVPLIAEATKDKSRLDALAFAVMIKETFVSSSIQSPTYSRLRSIFHMGNDKLRRLVTNGCKYGYLRFDNGFLVANKLSNEKEYKIKVDTAFYTASFTKKNECVFKHKDIKELILKSAILNHINKVNDCYDTSQKAQNPNNVREYKKARARLKCMHSKKSSSKCVSIRRFVEVTNSTFYSVKKAIKSLKSNGTISSVCEFVQTDIKPSEFDSKALAWLKATGNIGHFFAGKNGKKDVIYCKLAGVYSVNKQLITYEL